MSYLMGVKDSLEDVFLEMFDKAWKQVVEPALKESYKNGVADGRKAAAGDEPKPAAAHPQRRHLGKRSAPDREQEA